MVFRISAVFHIKYVDKILDVFFEKTPHAELAKRSVLLAVWTSVFLVAIKAISFWLTKSISMQASLNDSFLDTLTSFAAYHALKFSTVKYDEGHNFGHEKVEGLVALLQCLIITFSGCMIFKETFEQFIEPTPVANTTVGVAVMVISCLSVYQLIYFQLYTARKTDSMIVKGDSLHYLSDFLMNLCVMLSLILSRYFVYVDAICGVLVGAYVLYNALLIMKNALNDLMDESLPAQIQKQIRAAIMSVHGIDSIKILRTRSAGMKKYVEARVTVGGKVSFKKADEITCAAEAEIKKLFENVDVIIKAEAK